MPSPFNYHRSPEFTEKISHSLFSQLNPYFISVDSLTLFPGTKLFDMEKDGKFIQSGEKERIQELQILIQNLQIRTHLFANSKSNFYPTAAYLPKERSFIIRELQNIINTVSEEEMQRYRSTMQSLE